MRDQRLWTWHIGAGLVILVFLGLHMVTMHLEGIVSLFNYAEGRKPIDWANVVLRAKSVAFLVSYIALLGAGLFHGLYGLRNILSEMHLGAAFNRAMALVLLVGGLGLFGFGTWAAYQSFSTAQNVNVAQNQ